MRRRHWMGVGALAAVGLLAACGNDSVTGTKGMGRVALQLTDAPFPTDSVARVDIFVIRLDAKEVDTDSADVDRGMDDDGMNEDGWTVVAKPDTTIELLALQHGFTATLGEGVLPPGVYRSFRFVFDPSRSSVTLKNGTVLTASSNPRCEFPSGNRAAIRIHLDSTVTVRADSTTNIVVDFNVGDSFQARGPSLFHDGLLFAPFIHAWTRH